MSLSAAAGTGLVVGVHHALETDHLAAVTTLVETDGAYPGVAGASWGVGHTGPVAAVGLLLVLAGVRLPAGAAAVAEAVVGLLLVALGARLLWRTAGGRVHTHHGGIHAHVPVGRVELGWDHSHLDGESLVVGAVHGLAGSGALVVVLVAAAPSASAAVAFLVAFGLATTGTMGVVAVAWGRALGTPLASGLRAAAGAVGIAVGTWLATGVLPG